MPLGTSFTHEGVNFALFSRHAKAVTLVLSPGNGKTKKFVEISLDPTRHKTGDVWHILIDDLHLPCAYGYRLTGDNDRTSGHSYHDKRIMLDPYAIELRSYSWGAPWKELGKEPACLLTKPDYDWEGDRPLNIPLKDSIIYEMHVRGFTCHTSSQVRHPGTFQGICEKVEYLQELGITAVELMPVTEFNENESLFADPDTNAPLKNYWGYNPLSFFAPKSGYCSNPENPINEFRDMVKTLHKAGIEVILDIVYNHTAEGGYDGPTTSFRGIDNQIYYLLDPWSKEYLNFSGCGNTCNCNHPIMRRLILDALQWWVVHMHVDGFRFDLASILGRDSSGNVLANPPVVEMIAENPILANTKIIAEAWDAAGLYQVGSYSAHHRWAEWNGRYRDDLRAFMCGHEGMVSALATRIAGSSDLYQHDDKRPFNSINFITSHDGFTLSDLVSYNEKHNRKNGENNRDGDNHNISWNSGVEGETGNAAVKRLRLRRCRTMLTILFISQGVPMLVAGDECGRTQQGNNNAWCQDNEISWFDWTLVQQNKHLVHFVQHLTNLRASHPVFRRDNFFITADNENEPPHMQEISWHSLVAGQQDWSRECRTLAFLLNGSRLVEPDDDFYVMLNGHTDVSRTFTVPPPPRGKKEKGWKKIIDSCQTPPHDCFEPDTAPVIPNGAKITIANMGCIVLQSYVPASEKKKK